MSRRPSAGTAGGRKRCVASHLDSKKSYSERKVELALDVVKDRERRVNELKRGKN